MARTFNTPLRSRQAATTLQGLVNPAPAKRRLPTGSAGPVRVTKRIQASRPKARGGV